MGDRLGALTIKLLKEFENGFHCSDIVQHFDVIGMTFLSLFFFFFLFKLRLVKAGTFLVVALI